MLKYCWDNKQELDRGDSTQGAPEHAVCRHIFARWREVRLGLWIWFFKGILMEDILPFFCFKGKTTQSNRWTRSIKWALSHKFMVNLNGCLSKFEFEFHFFLFYPEIQDLGDKLRMVVMGHRRIVINSIASDIDTQPFAAVSKAVAHLDDASSSSLIGKCEFIHRICLS